jgi:hypothetical protein
MPTRRGFLISAATLSLGFVARASDTPSAEAAKVRQPAVGQTWRYAKHDFFTGAMVDTQLDGVTAVGQSIRIESHSETAADHAVNYPAWGSSWLQKYIGLESIAGPAPTEIQVPWGMVIVDPHWTDPQVYEKPIPLWPVQLRPGWSTTVTTYYKIPGSNETMPWQLTMRAQRWESITVPAGQFTALRYFNLVDFRYTNVSERVAGMRKENIWFAPELGRWVVRESFGTFREDLGVEVDESSYRWELLDWT